MFLYFLSLLNGYVNQFYTANMIILIFEACYNYLHLEIKLTVILIGVSKLKLRGKRIGLLYIFSSENIFLDNRNKGYQPIDNGQ